MLSCSSDCILCTQRSGSHEENLQMKAGWLGFSASLASGLGGLVVGRYLILSVVLS